MARCSSRLRSSCPSSVTASFSRTSISGVCRVQARNWSPHGSGELHEHVPGLSGSRIAGPTRPAPSHTNRTAPAHRHEVRAWRAAEPGHRDVLHAVRRCVDDNAPSVRRLVSTSFIRGAISTTRRVAETQWGASHISQTTTAARGDPSPRDRTSVRSASSDAARVRIARRRVGMLHGSPAHIVARSEATSCLVAPRRASYRVHLIH